MKTSADLREGSLSGYLIAVTALPKPRGPLSVALQSALRDLPVNAMPRLDLAPESPDDAAISLWMLHELSYGGFDDIADDAEDEPEIVRVRRRLEQDFEASLRRRWPGMPDGVDLAAGFFDWVGRHDGPSLARYVQTEATRRAGARPAAGAFGLPPQGGRPHDVGDPAPADGSEGGAGRACSTTSTASGDPNRLHAHLWARGMAASGLRPEYGAYVDAAPFEILEQNNAVSMFGLKRRLRGAAVGHLAAFEATSSIPSRQMAQGLERLGFPAEMIGYYTEHVEADAVHEQVALRDVCVALVREEPSLVADVWFGAWACLELESRAAQAILDWWGVAA